MLAHYFQGDVVGLGLGDGSSAGFYGQQQAVFLDECCCVGIVGGDGWGDGFEAFADGAVGINLRQLWHPGEGLEAQSDALG